MNQRIVGLLFCVFIFTIQAMDNQSRQRNNELIKKYASTTLKQDLMYAKAVIVASNFPSLDYRGEITDKELKELNNQMVSDGIDLELREKVKRLYKQHKTTITKRAANCYYCLVVTPIIVSLATLFPLWF